MNLEEIKNWLEENKNDEGVKTFLGEISKPTKEGVESFLETDEGKKLLQPKLDSYFTKGLSTFKEKTMPQIIEDELKKRTSNKDDKDLQMDQLRQEIESIKREKLRESLGKSAYKFATDNSLPTDLIEYFIKIENEDDDKGTKSKEATEANLNSLKEVWSNHLQQTVNEKLKSNGFNPKDGDKKTQTITKEQLQSMSREEIDALDWEVVSEALKN